MKGWIRIILVIQIVSEDAHDLYFVWISFRKELRPFKSQVSIMQISFNEFVPYRLQGFDSCYLLIRNALTCHRFPMKNFELLRKWVQFVGKGSEWSPKPQSRLCGEHFEFSAFILSSSKLNLVSDAIPTIRVSNYTTRVIYTYRSTGLLILITYGYNYKTVKFVFWKSWMRINTKPHSSTLFSKWNEKMRT